MELALEILLELQHIDQRLKELDDPREVAHLQELGFAWDPEQRNRLTQLWQKRAEQLDPVVLRHYTGLKERYGQAVVPLDGGICLGCFMAIPTSFVQRIRAELDVHTCGHCGRILYWVDS